MRGFRFQDFKAQITNKELCTPTLDIWLLKIPNYDSKIDAYKAGISASNAGWGVYVLPENNKWTWVAGVYATESDANTALSQAELPTDAIIHKYQINGKKFSLESEAYEPCQKVLYAVQSVFNLLLDLRLEINQAGDVNNLQLALTTAYNEIKDGAETLQRLNTNLHHEFIATVIYTANQNILGLQDVICLNQNTLPSLTTVNNALLKTIFSLDNF